MTHSQGTIQNPYGNLTADTSQFTVPSPEVESTPLPSYMDRFKDANWLYLLGKNTPGDLFCKKRGKQLVLAAGNVSFFW